MNAAEKLLQRMRQSASGWKPDDFERLYVGFGFSKKEGGNHTTYIHETYKDLLTQVPRHGSLANAYARTAVSLIDELKQRKSENNDE